MNLRQLQYFVEAFRCGSYATAGRRLFVTSRAVSKAVHDLEKEIGHSLFNNHGGSIIPTDYAISYMKPALDVLKSVEKLEEFQGKSDTLKSEKPTLRIGVANSYLRGFTYTADEVYSAGAALKDHAEIKTIVSLNGSCIYALCNNFLDAAIVFGKHEISGYSCTKLYTYDSQIVLSCNHHLANKMQIDISLLENERIAAPLDLAHVYPQAENCLGERGIFNSFSDIGVQLDEHQSFVNDGGMIFVAKRNELKEQLANIVVKELEPKGALSLPVCFIYKEINPYGKQLRALRNQLLRSTPSIL